MPHELTDASQPIPAFENLTHLDEEGVEYWTARELMPSLGYQSWESFLLVIKRAMLAAINSGQELEDHFRHLTKMVELGSGSVREVKDYKLDRYACYLIAQNGDSKKVEIAMAQTYFTLQTRKQELMQSMPNAEKRLFIREEVANENKKLFRAAAQAGVSHFGLFNDAGYRGLYGTSLAEVERLKGIEKGDLLDRAGSTELAANLFRITQTEEKLKKNGTRSDAEARRIHNMVGGKVRQTIKDIGGVTPEHLRPELHLREVRKEVKRLAKSKSAALSPVPKRLKGDK